MALVSKQYEACLSLLDPLKHNQLKKEYIKLVKDIYLNYNKTFRGWQKKNILHKPIEPVDKKMEPVQLGRSWSKFILTFHNLN